MARAMRGVQDLMADDDILVRVENLVKYFPVKAGGLSRTP